MCSQSICQVWAAIASGSERSWSSIDEWIGKRSGGMVVITVISSCLLAVLLLLLGAVLLLTMPALLKTIV
ncbi:unnamed protein product [Coregonus sp. 'balchen']|nr:unnamed protein product [Coregonus sp. 'balchen']